MRLRTTLKSLTLPALAVSIGVWSPNVDAAANWTRHVSRHVAQHVSQMLTGTPLTKRTPLTPRTPPPPPDTSKNAFAKLVVKNLGPRVNSVAKDLAPTITADGRTMYFVSDREGSQAQDFWQITSPEGNDTTWLNPTDVREINSDKDDGAASIAADGQTIYFATSRNTTAKNDVNLWVATLEGSSWKNVHELGAPINTSDWESQPSISPDDKRLFFASNREGSMGGNKKTTDIYVSHHLPDGRWGVPVNLGSKINTDKNDLSPFIATDGTTLYFASDGQPGGLGGFDLYKSTWVGPSDTDWTVPEALPAPINSTADDFFLTLPASGNILFFTSNRAGGSGNYDLYMATNPPPPKPTLVLKGTAYDVNTKEKLGARVMIVEEKTGDTVYNKLANSATGEYLAVLHSNSKGELGGGYIISATEPNHFNYSPNRELITVRSDTNRIITHDIPMNNENPPLVHWVTQTPQLLSEKPGLFGDNFKGVVIREQKTIELFTLLPMVFFDLGSPALTNRYVKYTSPEQTNGFTEDTLSGTLNAYYNYLNIIGLRLRNNPSTNITLTGCNSQDVDQEKSVDLSRQRAEGVKKYLVEIWGVSPERIKLEARKLPENPTLPSTPEGIEENRRVELVSDSWEIVHPVLHSDLVKRPDMPTGGFTFESGLRPDVIEKRELLLSYQGRPWNVITNLGDVSTTSYNGYNWRSAEGNKLPSGQDNMQVQLRLTDKSGRQVLSNVDEIAVRQFSVAEMGVEHLQDKTRETYNLILFKYNSADMGKWNHKILDTYVYNRIQPNSDVTVNGYTDILGTPDYNEKLSTNRANAVKSDIAGHIKGKVGSLVSHGFGKTQPLYTNELPEGRYYNRTVQVLVETPTTGNP